MRRTGILLALLSLLAFAGIAQFFFTFAAFTFDQQEEMQLFIPEWAVLWPQLLQPGKLYAILGMYCSQYFYFPLPAALLTAFFTTGTGLFGYLLLQRLTGRSFNILLALFPVFVLLKAHLQVLYVIDGTLAFMLILLLLYVVCRQTNEKRRLAFALIAALLVYGIAGQLVIPYALLFVVYEYLYSRRRSLFPLTVPLIALLLAYTGVRSTAMFPLTDGFHGIAYHETQLQSDSYVYFVWIILTAFYLALFALAKVLNYIPRKKKVFTWLVNGVLLFCLLGFASFCLPNRQDMQDRTIHRLAYLSRRQDWDPLIAMHTGKRIPSPLNLSYLNMALAQKGALASRLFYFDQRGPQGLLPSYDFTYHSSILLSDIHFLTGDISLSESYAMEALTMARRQGSPRALQRLVQISLIRHEWALAGKYLSLLKRMPVYTAWASHYETYLHHPEKIASDPELKDKKILPAEERRLLSMIDIETLWHDNRQENPSNRTVFEYMGCSYLLAKQMDKFSELLLQAAELPSPLPIHFQEAALLAFEGMQAIPQAIEITPSVRQRYTEFQQQLAQASNKQEGYNLLYKQYNNTFWFYYHFK